MSDTDTVLSGLKAGKKLMGEIETSVSGSYLIDGKSSADWKKELSIRLPQVPTIDDIKSACARMVCIIDTIGFYRANAQLIMDAIEQGSRDKYLERYQEQVDKFTNQAKANGHSKLPSATTLEALAANGMKEIDGAKANASMKHRWWKNMMESASEQRKALEQVMWATNIELKTQSNGSWSS